MIVAGIGVIGAIVSPVASRPAFLLLAAVGTAGQFAVEWLTPDA
jgi:hypothetical protein